jgi:RimJ/RimL family protein N-acetyltransferase
MKKITNQRSAADPTVFLHGNRIYLRPVKESDINNTYLSWLNDSEVTRFLDTGVFPVTFEELKAFYHSVASARNVVMFAIIEKKTKRHIGNIKLGGINWVHRFADLGILIGDKRSWGKGFGQEACRLVLEYAFDRLNLHKVILGVYANHASAIKAYTKIGFNIEGRLKDLLFYKDGYVDKLYMGVTEKVFSKHRLTE